MSSANVQRRLSAWASIDAALDSAERCRGAHDSKLRTESASGAATSCNARTGCACIGAASPSLALSWSARSPCLSSSATLKCAALPRRRAAGVAHVKSSANALDFGLTRFPACALQVLCENYMICSTLYSISDVCSSWFAHSCV